MGDAAGTAPRSLSRGRETSGLRGSGSSSRFKPCDVSGFPRTQDWPVSHFSARL
jgi:hypothetical protein